jgi:hypothetical protein
MYHTHMRSHFEDALPKFDRFIFPHTTVNLQLHLWAVGLIIQGAGQPVVASTSLLMSVGRSNCAAWSSSFGRLYGPCFL